MNVLVHAVVRFVLGLVLLPVALVLLIAAGLAWTQNQQAAAVALILVMLFLSVLARSFRTWMDNRL